MSRPVYWLRARRQLAKNDPVMAGILAAFPRIFLESRGAPFLTLVRSIVGQQISVKAAASIWNRLLVVAPEMLPDQLIKVGAPQLRLCGLSERKAEYVSGLAADFLNGSLRVDNWPDMNDESVIADLIKVGA